jgi:hypothetical protein
VLFDIGYMICGIARGMLFVKLTNVEDDWLWRSDMTDNKLELGLGCFGRLAAKKMKGMMESIGGGEEPIAWYG